MRAMHRGFGASVLALVASSVAFAQAPVIQNRADAKWGAAPPMLPAGAQIAVVSGDPGKPAPYAVRLKFPANYVIPSHSHPTDENVLVISGTFFVGMGDKLNKSAATAVPDGGYVLAPASMNHYAFTTKETTILLYGVGPVEFKYVNPNDDPRHATHSGKQ